jgi:DNA mismatch repair protein MutS
LKDYERKSSTPRTKFFRLKRNSSRQFATYRRSRPADSPDRRRDRELDVTAALAQVAAENRYTRPRFSADDEMRIEGGRHPVIERLAEQESGRFIPNDLF